MNTAEQLAILQCATGDSLDKIRAAWKRLVMIHHPDKGGRHDMIVKINAAYDHLKKVYNPPKTVDFSAAYKGNPGAQTAQEAADYLNRARWAANIHADIKKREKLYKIFLNRNNRLRVRIMALFECGESKNFKPEEIRQWAAEEFKITKANVDYYWYRVYMKGAK